MPWKCLACIKSDTEEIVRLDYRHCSLSDVPPEVFAFERTLEELFLDANRIKDLPRPLFHCHGLRHLGLSDNEIQSIPPAISSLINLEHLDISKNAISGIPDSIKGCKVLTTVDASVNPLEKLPEGFMQLLALEELYLNDSYLEFLPANFGRLQKLRILELRENHLNTLPKSIARLVNLQRLDIGQNEFSDVPEVVGQLPNITELWCDFNRIRSIPQFVGNLKKLVHLDASNNNINWVASDIENCQKLSDLTLSGNEIQEIPGSIGNLKSLMTLKLDDNQLSVLPESIGKMSSLEELILSQNDFETLPPSIGLLRKLHILNVDENMLEDLPPEIGSCCNLRILSVAGNRLVQIPGEIGHLTNLKVANLSGNRLTNLPVSLLGLSSLAALWLSDNQAQPLVPLQPDVDHLTGQRVLTCFMLPQTCSVPAEVRTPPQVVVPGYIPVGDSDAEGDARSEEERIRRRHIRFAADSELDVGGRLLRAPTPYPKELRALARHARSLQRVSHATNGPVSAPPPPLCQGSFSPPHQREGEGGTPVVAEWIPSGIQENKIKEAKVTKAQTSPSVVNEVRDPGMEPVFKRSPENEELQFKEEISSMKKQTGEVEVGAEKVTDLSSNESRQNGTECNTINETVVDMVVSESKDIVDFSSNVLQSENRNASKPSQSDSNDLPPVAVAIMSQNASYNGSKEEQRENIKFLPNLATPPQQPPPYYIAAAYSKKAALFNSDVQSRSSISSLPPFSLPSDRLTPLLETKDRARPSSVASKYDTSQPTANHPSNETKWTNSPRIGQREEDPVKDDLEELSERVEASLNELGLTAEERPFKISMPHVERLTSLSSPSHKTDLSPSTTNFDQNMSTLSSFETSPTPSGGGEHLAENEVRSDSPHLERNEKNVASIAPRVSGDDYTKAHELYNNGNSSKSSPFEEDVHQIPCDSSPVAITSTSSEISPQSNSEALDIVLNSVTPEITERKGSYVPDATNDSPKTVMGGSRIPVSKVKVLPRSANEEMREMNLGKPPNFTQDKPSAGTHLIAPTPQRANSMPTHNNGLDAAQDLASPLNNSYGSGNNSESSRISPSRIPSVSSVQSPKSSQSWQRTSPLQSFTSKMPSPGFSMTKKSSIPSPLYGNSRPVVSPPPVQTVEGSPSPQPRPAASTSPHSKIPHLAGMANNSFVGSNRKSPPPKASDPMDKLQKSTVGSSKIPMLHSSRVDTSPVAEVPNKSRIPVSPQSKLSPPSKNWMFGLHKNAMVFPVSIHKNPGLGFSIAGGHHPSVSPDKQDNGIYITKVHPSGPASGSLIPGDKILEVDGIDFTKLEHDQAVSILTQTGNVVQMMISRNQ